MRDLRQSRKVREACLWIKEYSHALRVVGGAFFVVALICGLIWATGKEIEPIAFVFGLLSSLFFALPSIADYVVPDRKPIRHMTFQEILDFIESSDPVQDWHGVSLTWSSETFLKEDPRLRFRSSHENEDVQNENFVEDWANNHPDQKAVGYYYNLIYDGALIDRFILVSVDGARARWR